MNGIERDEIHPSAIVSDNAHLGRGVTIGANSIIFDNVSLGEGSVVGPNCILGEPTADFYTSTDYDNPHLVVGAKSRIRSGSILYAGSSIGPDFETGHRVTIRESSRIGHHVRIGTLSDIQGDCSIGNYARLHSNVHIGQKSDIRDYVWIFPYTVLTNDPQPPSEILLGVTIDEFAVLATMVVVLPGVVVGRDALVGAHSLVRSDVEPEAVVVGVPAKKVSSVREIRSRGASAGEAAYPWREHFDRGMPWEGVGYDAWWARQHDGDAGRSD